MIFAETAPAYYAAGLQCIPLIGKKPRVTGWAKIGKGGVDAATFSGWLDSYGSSNIGLLLGPASGLCAIDVDGLPVPTADRVLAKWGLATPYRRVGAKGFVALFRWHPGVRSFQIKAPDGSVLIEVLAQGRQVVLPPSIHPDTRKPYTANCDLLDVLADLPEMCRGD